jgi:hypothetical protein
MKLEITMTEQEIKESQIRYLVGVGLINPEWKITEHYPTLGLIKLDTDEECVEPELSYREAKEGN